MPVYPKWILECLNHPFHCGTIGRPDGEGKAASVKCGSYIGVQISVDDKKDISDAKYQGNGCGFMIAAAEGAISVIKGRNLTALGDIEVSILDGKPYEWPPEREQCRSIVVDAIRSAFADHRKRIVDEFSGDDALVCSCFGVGEARVRNSMTAHGSMTVEEVGSATNAGTGCGSCRMIIQEILDSE